MKEAVMNTVTHTTFSQEVLQAGRPVLVEFMAQWCQPCKRLAPTLHKFAEQHPSIKVMQVDIDSDFELASFYNIVGVPTVLLFDRGELVMQLPKGITMRVLENELQEYI